MLRRVIAAMSLLSGLLVFAIIGSPYWLNDRALAAQSARLDALSLPPDTTIVGRHDEVGLQVCCSNHCDFFSGRAIETTLDLPTLRAALPDLEVVPADALTDEDLSMRGLRTLHEQTNAAHQGERYYIYAFEQVYGGFAFAGDLRCH